MKERYAIYKGYSEIYYKKKNEIRNGYTIENMDNNFERIETFENLKDAEDAFFENYKSDLYYNNKYYYLEEFFLMKEIYNEEDEEWEEDWSYGTLEDSDLRDRFKYEWEDKTWDELDCDEENWLMNHILAITKREDNTCTIEFEIGLFINGRYDEDNELIIEDDSIIYK